MWTQEARELHKSRPGRYPSDLTDVEWALIEPMIPPPRRGGRHRETDMREAMNAVRYVLRTGCQWRALPKDFPPRSTVYNYFWEWSRLMACWTASIMRSSSCAGRRRGARLRRARPSSIRRA